ALRLRVGQAEKEELTQQAQQAGFHLARYTEVKSDLEVLREENFALRSGRTALEANTAGLSVQAREQQALAESLAVECKALREETQKLHKACAAADERQSLAEE
ncbi:unnamed protein product, partial [Polarella glacialis]